MDGIHATAVIDPAAEIGSDVSIGPYTVVEGPVIIGAGTRIGPHCHISGRTTIGESCRIHAGAIVGDEPQDHKFDAGMDTYLRIGAHVIIREYAQIHRSANEGQATVIGDHAMIMGFVHVAHDCIVGDHVVLANGVKLAGHTEVGEKAFLSADSCTHQFVRVGEFAMVSQGGRLNKDVPPYCTISDGNRVFGPNVVGLRRGGFDSHSRRAIRSAIKRLLFGQRPLSELLDELAAAPDNTPEVKRLISFIRDSKRGVLTSAQSNRQGMRRGSAENAPADSSDE